MLGLGGRGTSSNKAGAREADPRFPKEWCVFALLYAATLADNIIAAEEEAEVDALLLRARSLCRMSQESVDAYVAQYREILTQQNSVTPLVDLACQKLPAEKGLGEAVFAHCVDIVFCDRAIVGDERDFLAELGRQLAIPKTTQSEIIEVMSWKNAY